MDAVFLAIGIAGVIILLMLDNARYSGKLFDKEQVGDFGMLHHEHIEIVLALVMVVILWL